MMLFNPYHDLYQLLRKLPEAERLEARKKLIWAYSWAVPTAEVIYKIAKYSPLIELGSGTGYWGWLITQAGGQIQCLDHQPMQPPCWMEIHHGSPQSISERSERETLLLCWPPLNNPMSTQSLRSYTGNTVIYIGEWRGRTAEADFHDELETMWNLKETLDIPNWPNFSDRLYIFKRKK